jgi:iron complex outermembrane receptor protein
LAHRQLAHGLTLVAGLNPALDEHRISALPKRHGFVGEMSPKRLRLVARRDYRPARTSPTRPVRQKGIVKMKLNLIAGVGAAALLSAFAPGAFAADGAAADGANEVEAIIIYGEGQSRQVQTVSEAQIAESVSGVSPLKVLDKLPGVTFQSADPFGTYEWSTRISIRGFNQNQLGFTLDNVPLGDMSYGNHNGLHISRAIASEDISRVELAQGAGALSNPSSSNLGGTIQFFSRDPSDAFGGQANVTLGSDNMRRGFLRLESGELEALGGLRGYVSYADQSTDKWKGGGEQKQRQFDVKAVLPVGEGDITAFYNVSERREQDYQDLSFDIIKRLGSDWDNTQPDWDLAIAAAAAYQNGTPLPAPFGTVDDAYYAGAGVRDDNLAGLSLDLPIGDMVTINATAYSHTDEGQGLWYTPYLASPGYGTVGSNAAPLSIRTTEYEIDRKGLVGGVTLDLGAHTVSGGFWVENNEFNQARRFYAETFNRPSRDPLGFQSNPFFTQWEYAFETRTLQFYLQDVWAITEALKVNFGFKTLKVENEVSTVQVFDPTRAMEAQLDSEDNFLPQIGFVYQADNGVEVFGGYTENVAAYVSAGTAGPFASQRQSVVDYVSKNLEPESSKTFEGGLRYRNDRFQGVAAVYHVTFDNRLLAASTAAPILGLPAVLSNVGSVETNGLELAGELELTDNLSIYASYAYNKSEYQDDVVSATGVVEMATAGKTVVNTPENLFKAELSYDRDGFFSKLAVSYTGSRFYTYENIGGEVDAYTVTDLTLGYHFSGNPWLEGLDIQANVTNLFDEDYISTIGSGGFVKNDAGGFAQTILNAPPRQVFFTVKKAF